MTTFKKIILIAVIVLSLSSACGTIPQTSAVMPSPIVDNSNALWSTYRNDAYGFTFEYPAIYDDAAYKDSCSVKENGAGIHLGHQIDLLFLNADGLGLMDFTNTFLQSKGWSVESQNNDPINGFEAITVQYRFGGTNRFGTLTLVKQNDQIFAFNFSAGGFCEVPMDQPSEPNAYSHLIETFVINQPSDEIPAPSEQTLSGNVYHNSKYGYSLSYPDSYNVTAMSDEYVEIGDKIVVVVRSVDPAVALGDGPVIENTMDIQIAGYSAKLLTGYIGSVGGYLPQQIRQYVVERNGFYFVSTLYALGLHFTEGDISQIAQLNSADVSLFDNMMTSLQIP